MRHPLLIALATVMLAGCGTAAHTGVSTANATRLQARSDEGLHQGVLALRKQRFERLDLNHDEALTPDEASTEALYLPGLISGFQDYDANGDRKITLTEFLREDVIQYWMDLIRPKIREYFDKVDANRDGVLTGSERQKTDLFFSPMAQLHGGDLNQDGSVTFSEFEDAYMVILPFYQPNPNGEQGLR